MVFCLQLWLVGDVCVLVQNRERVVFLEDVVLNYVANSNAMECAEKTLYIGTIYFFMKWGFTTFLLGVCSTC